MAYATRDELTMDEHNRLWWLQFIHDDMMGRLRHGEPVTVEHKTGDVTYKTLNSKRLDVLL